MKNFSDNKNLKIGNDGKSGVLLIDRTEYEGRLQKHLPGSCVITTNKGCFFLSNLELHSHYNLKGEYEGEKAILCYCKCNYHDQALSAEIMAVKGQVPWPSRIDAVLKINV